MFLDLSRKITFSRITFYFNKISNFNQSNKLVVLLGNNKNDKRKVEQKEIDKLCKEYKNIYYFEVNCFDEKNFDNFIDFPASLILNYGNHPPEKTHKGNKKKKYFLYLVLLVLFYFYFFSN